MNQVANEWKDYECIDTGNGEKVKKEGNVIVRRPDQKNIWNVEYNSN